MVGAAVAAVGTRGREGLELRSRGRARPAPELSEMMGRSADPGYKSNSRSSAETASYALG